MSSSEATGALSPIPAGGGESLISLRNVSKIFPMGKTASVSAVMCASLEVGRGEFIVITGRSGSGKTTLLNLAAGLTRPTSGQVYVDGQDIWQLPDRQQSLLRNQKMGFVFQFPSLLPSLTVHENVVLPTIFGPRHGQMDADERATSLLGELGIGDKMLAYPRQLSAGQQKRVVIARSLINRPEALMADEPTSDLDEQTEREFMELLRGVHESRGLTILMVTHNRDLIPYGTRAIEMTNGEMVT